MVCGYRYDFLLLLIAMVSSLSNADSPEINAISASPKESIGPAWVGYSLLGVEYIIGPIVASQYWWNHALQVNPFTNIEDESKGEPYFEDKIWHFWNGENITDFHYWVLKRYFGKDSEWGAMGLTFLTATGVELMDASDGGGRWGFSLYDEAANISGILFWYLKHKYPQIPVDVRVGIRRWDKVGLLIDRSWDISGVNAPNRGSTHMDNYSILKAEIIIRPYNYLYIGLGVSLKTDSLGYGTTENLYGISVGFDVLRWYANKYPGKLTPFANTCGRYLSESIAYTYWFDD